MINNYLSPLEFQIHIKRLPNVEFFAQSVTLAGLSSTPQETENPYNRLMWKGEKTVYSSLDISFIIDENMENWLEIHDWIVGTTSPQDASQFRNLRKKETIYSDITVSVLSNKKNQNIDFTYFDAFPYALSPVTMDTRGTDPFPVVATASFAYSYYTVANKKALITT